MSRLIPTEGIEASKGRGSRGPTRLEIPQAAGTQWPRRTAESWRTGTRCPRHTWFLASVRNRRAAVDEAVVLRGRQCADSGHSRDCHRITWFNAFRSFVDPHRLGY